MTKKYYSLKAMTRGLAFFYTTGIQQYFDEKELHMYAQNTRPNHGFIYLNCDSATFTLKNGKKLTFKKGNFIYIPMDINYTVQFCGTPKDDYTDLQITFRLVNIKGEEYYLADEPVCILKNTPGKIINCMQTIADATVNLSYPTFRIKRAFGEMLEAIENRIWLPEMNEGENSRVFPALYYLDKHIADDVSISDLAKICTLNQTTFRREFHKATGMTPVQYKSDLRIKKAKELIRYSPDISTDEIVAQLGFHDASYFYKTFTKLVGETLKQYRKRYK